MNTPKQTLDTQDETTTDAPGFFHRGILERLGWTETRDEIGSVWRSGEVLDDCLVVIRPDGTIDTPNRQSTFTSIELRAFAAVADSERKDPKTGERPPAPSLFTLEPEQQARANHLAQQLTASGIECNADEAQMMANLADFGRQTMERADANEDPDAIKLRTHKTVELFAGTSRFSHVCLTALAKLVIRQHRGDYQNDANLRGLDIVDTLLHIVAVCTPDKRKLKHTHG
jgi:hypothetical protein